MKIAFVAAAFPPDLDGVGDYTWWLADSLSQKPDTEVTVFTRSGAYLPLANVQVIPIIDRPDFSTVARLPDALAAAGLDKPGSWVVFQYNPFSWGRRGWCPDVPRALAEIKRRFPQVGLSVMFHETTVPRWPWRFTIMRLWQRRFFRASVQCADVALASSERYVKQIQRVSPPCEVVHLPVGSNLAKSHHSKAEARQKLGLEADTIYVGVFGTAHVSRLLDWIATAFRSIQKKFPTAKVLYVGPEGEAVANALGGRDSMIDLGIQPADAAGTCFRAMDLLLVPFDDGISTRRGSAIAALQHGVPVASTLTRWTDSVFRDHPNAGILLSSADSAESFSEDVIRWSTFLGDESQSEALRTAIEAFHDQTFAWRVVADALATTLERTNPR